MNLDFERCSGCMWWVPFHKSLGSLGYCILNDHEYELGVIPVGKMAQCPRERRREMIKVDTTSKEGNADTPLMVIMSIQDGSDKHGGN